MEAIKKGFRCIRNWLRFQLITKKKSKRLIDKDISIISSDCTGGVIYHDFNMKFLSPTINLYMDAPDYLKFIKNIEGYKNLPFVDLPIEREKNGFPMAMLGDIKLYLVHYKSTDEAQEAWNRRKDRINPNKLFFIMNDRNKCTFELIKEFDKFLAGEGHSGVCFTHVRHEELKSVFYITGSEDKDCVDTMTVYTKGLSRRLDQYDWVEALSNL